MSNSALIYCRVSQDRSGGRSVAEQETECRAVCDREGWAVADVLTDNDIGASRHSKGERVAWAAVKDRIAKGDIHVLVCWEASRAGRDLGGFVELRDLLEKHDVLVNYSGRTLDLSNPSDRFVSGLDAIIAEREADETSKRIRRATAAQAQAGLPHGRRLFGYRRLYDADTGRLMGQRIDEEEAVVVRRIFRDYLAGKGTRTIARELNSEGFTTGTGAKWADTQVNRVLLNVAYMAKRVHKGEIVGDAVWSPIVDTDTFTQAARRRDAQRTNKWRNTGTARLLTGVGRCGLCGSKLAAIHDRNKRKVYTCKDKYEVSRDGKKLDAYIGNIVVERLSMPDVRQMLESGSEAPPEAVEALSEAEALRGRLDDAASQFAAGEITVTMLAKVEQALAPQIDACERKARSAVVPPLAIDVPPEGVAGWWEALEPGERRQVVGALFAAVVVHPTAVRGRRAFDSAAISIEWAA